MKYGKWETIDRLGGGGQSDVYSARTPERELKRKESFESLHALSGMDLRSMEKACEFAKASWDLARPDLPEELGAVKVFKIRNGGAPAKERLKMEAEILLQNLPNLPKLLDNFIGEDEQWLVTEYFSMKTLAHWPEKYEGLPVLALRDFRILVRTVASSLHANGIVHRDLKPANIFVRTDGTLIPGDFGIAYLPGRDTRITQTDEFVGPWQYMPDWFEATERLDNVPTAFDVYVLGKLLWSMISGQSRRLRREDHRLPTFDLGQMFPSEKIHTDLINSILDKCLVDSPEKCLPSAKELLDEVDKALSVIDGEAPRVDGKGEVIMPCYICKKGYYVQQHATNTIRLMVGDEYQRQMDPIFVRHFVCTVCRHHAFFSPGYPQSAATKGWKPYSAG